MIYQVPKSVIALYEDTNYATARSADLSFWIRSLCPIMVRIEDKFNSSFLSRFGVYGKFNYRKIDALNSAFIEKMDAALKLMTLGYTLNQINARLDLGFEDVPWGDEPFSQSAPIVAEAQPKQVSGTTAVISSPKVAEIREAQEKAARARLWESLNMKIMPVASGCNKDLRKYYAEVEAKLFRKILKALPSAVVSKKLEPIAEEDLSALFSDDKMARILSKWVEVAMGNGASTIMGATFDAASESTLAAISAHVSKVTAINENARQKLIEVIRETMKQAVEQGLPEIDAADLLVKNAKQVMSEFTNHARTIARTEVHGAYSEARDKGMRETGAVGKKWITARNANVRDSHAALDGKVIPFDGVFSNGCRFPLDPGGAAGEVINCRCVHVPVYEGENT